MKNMIDIFKEIEQELKKEKFYLAIRQYYKGFIAIVMTILFTIFFYIYTKESNIRQQEELSQQYYELFVANNKLDKVKESDFGKLITFQKTIHAKFAKLQYANILVLDKQYTKAVDLLFNVISSSEKALEISNLAAIRAAELVMQYKITSYNNKILDILRKAVKKDNVPYFYILKLLLGQLLIEMNQKEGLNILEDVNKDAKTPQNIKLLSDVILENYLR